MGYNVALTFLDRGSSSTTLAVVPADITVCSLLTIFTSLTDVGPLDLGFKGACCCPVLLRLLEFDTTLNSLLGRLTEIFSFSEPLSKVDCWMEYSSPESSSLMLELSESEAESLPLLRGSMVTRCDRGPAFLGWSSSFRGLLLCSIVTYKANTTCALRSLVLVNSLNTGPVKPHVEVYYTLQQKINTMHTQLIHVWHLIFNNKALLYLKMQQYIICYCLNSRVNKHNMLPK